MTTHREVISTNDLAISTNHVTGRHLRTVFRFCNDFLCQTCGFISLSTEGDTFDDIVELKTTGILGHDNGIERIPLGNLIALLHLVTSMEVE